MPHLFKTLYHLAPKCIQDAPYMHLYRDYIPFNERLYIRSMKKQLPWYIHPVLMHSKHYYLSSKNLNRWNIIQSLRKDRIRRFGNTFLGESKYKCLMIKLKMFIYGQDIYSIDNLPTI